MSNRIITPQSRPAPQPGPGAQINIVPKSAVTKAILDTAAAIAEMNSKMLVIAGNLSNTLSTARAGDIAIRQMSLVGSPIDRSNFSGQAEVEALNAAYTLVVELSEQCTKASLHDVFRPPVHDVSDPDIEAQPAD